MTTVWDAASGNEAAVKYVRENVNNAEFVITLDGRIMLTPKGLCALIGCVTDDVVEGGTNKFNLAGY